MRHVAFVTTVALALAGCASRPAHIGGDPKLQVVEGNTLPAPSGRDTLVSGRPYYIGPFDKLTIDVYGIDALSRVDVVADASGRLSFPLAGGIEAMGKTPSEVEAIIAQRLRAHYIRDPKVTVNLREAVSQVITVEGEVAQPGIYPVIGQMTLLSAIASARGTTEFVKTDDVVIFRTVNGQHYAALYNIAAIRHGAYADPEVYPNDVVTVGGSQARRIFKDVLTAIPAIATPLVYLLK